MRCKRMGQWRTGALLLGGMAIHLTGGASAFAFFPPLYNPTPPVVVSPPLPPVTPPTVQPPPVVQPPPGMPPPVVQPPVVQLPSTPPPVPPTVVPVAPPSTTPVPTTDPHSPGPHCNSPEPASLVMGLMGAVAAGGVWWRRRKGPALDV